MLKLGIDTGGTFTDAVLFDEKDGVIATNKAVTTHFDLTIGINECIDKLVESHKALLPKIQQVCLSSTLATNALVESKGRSASLLLIGYDESFLQRGQLQEGLIGTPTTLIGGGHDAHGSVRAPLDEDLVIETVKRQKDEVHAFAVASYFSVRNPSHEQRVQEIIAEITDKPVTCSYQISSALNAPKRTLTTLLNAQLIPLIDELITAVQNKLNQLSINAKVMIVQGDGSLLAADQALHRPIQTILSGPAASVHGARYLSNTYTALISDIGGTTSDIALIENGLPTINSHGVNVGKWETMVEAINIMTYGIGGDSEVLIDHNAEISLSERRAIPVSLLASKYPQVHQFLDAQLSEAFKSSFGVFVVLNQKNINKNHLRSLGEKEIFELLSEHTNPDGIPQPVPLEKILKNASNHKIIAKLRDRGIVNISTFTPTDAAHILGTNNHFDIEAAQKIALILSRIIRQLYNKEVTANTIAEAAIEQLTLKSCAAISNTMISHHYEKNKKNRFEKVNIQYQSLLKHSFDANEKIDYFNITSSLDIPLIATGASANTYYPEIANRLNTQAVVPEHHDVCNAVGAVTAKVLRKATAHISSPEEDKFVCHLSSGLKSFSTLEDASNYCIDALREEVTLQAERSGAVDIEVSFVEDEKSVQLAANKILLLEKKIIACAIGAPI